MHTFPKTLPRKYNEKYFAKPFFLWQKCADDEMIKKFIDMGESLSTMEAQIGGKVVDINARVSTVSWIGYNDTTKDLYDFLIDKIDRINYYHYGMILNGVESIQYTRYPINGHYKFHNDIIARKEDNQRKLSLVLALTAPEEYEGGELLLMPNGDNPLKFKLGKGELIAFPSWVPHKVTPVTSGLRITAVNWVLGPKFV
jgi:PKHD-type hydroxylase